MTNIINHKTSYIIIIIAAALMLTVGVAHAAPPAGFTVETVTGGLNLPTAAAVSPSGEIFIAEKGGTVRILHAGHLHEEPFITLTDINDYGDRGLIGIALDPDFETNGYVYLGYTFENNAADYTGPKTGRIVRVKAVGDVADMSTYEILVGSVGGDAASPSCDDFPVTADCIPSDESGHSVGGLRFGPDGKLYATLGDGASFYFVDSRALRAQDIDSLAGKMLRINTDGTAPADNPFYSGDPSANRSKVWGYGFRNAFRFDFRPSNDSLYIGDVGWYTWEEINIGIPGANYGWPCREGFEATPGYACTADPYTDPLYAYGHAETGAGSVTAGVFYNGASYPAEYTDTYFFGDFAQDWIKRLVVDANDNLISVEDFMDSAGGPVEFFTDSEGNVNYLSIYTGELRRITFTEGNRNPIASFVATPTAGLAPLEVSFSSASSSDPDGDSLTFLWNFGDGATSTDPNPVYTYIANGTYTVQLDVSDGNGGVGTQTASISVGNLTPTATIVSPPDSSLYSIGQIIPLFGDGTDPEDGTLPESAYSWLIILHHNAHIHILQTLTGSSPSFIGPSHEDNEDVYVEVELTVTDSVGLTDTTSIDLYLAPLTEIDPFHLQTSVLPVSPLINELLTITSQVGNNGTSGPVLVDIELFDSAGTKIAQAFYDNQILDTGVTVSYTLDWTPTEAGSYRVAVGLIHPNWQGLYQWTNEALLFDVSAEPPTFSDGVYVENAGDFVSSADWAQMQTITVTLDEFSFTPQDLAFTAGAPYRLRIVNNGAAQHNFTAEEFYRSVAFRKAQDSVGEFKAPFFDTIEVFPGKSIDLYFIPIFPGVYDSLSTIEGDAGAGMFGTITVTGNIPISPLPVLANVADGDWIQNSSDYVNAADWSGAETVVLLMGESSGEYYFNPSELTFVVGRPYKLELINEGVIKHEFTGHEFFKTIAWWKVESSNGGVKAPTFAELEGFAGEQLDLYFIPTVTGTFDMVCEIPGHLEAGMFGTITVIGEADGTPPAHISTTASPDSVGPSGTTTITTVIHNPGLIDPFVVDIEIFDEAGAQVHQEYYESQTIPVGQSAEYVFDWTVPSTLGVYRVAVGLIHDGWSGLYEWTDEAELITISDTSPPPPDGNDALLFDGVDDYVDAGAWNIEEANFTIEALFKMNTETGGQKLISKSDGTGYVWSLGLTDEPTGHGHAHIEFSLDTDGVITTLEGGLVDVGTLTHIAAVYDGSEIRLYQDGVAVTSTPKTGAITQNLAPVWVGNDPIVPIDGAFDGIIDDMRVWNVVRSDADIAANIGVDLVGDEVGLIKYWKFNEGFGQDVIDRSNNGHHGRLGSTSSGDTNDPVWNNGGPTVMTGTFIPVHDGTVAEDLGSSYSITTTVSNTGTNPGHLIINMEIYDASGTQIDQQFRDGETLQIGESRNFTFDWTAPTDGTYRVAIGLIELNWVNLYSWTDDAVIIVVGAPPLPPAKAPIYKDTLELGWVSWSWDTTLDFAHTTTVFEGVNSIESTFTAMWGGVYLHNDAVDTTGHTSLSFAISGGATGGQGLQIRPYDASNAELPALSLAGYIPGGTPSAGAWDDISIPLADLGIADTIFTGFIIQGNTGGVEATFYLDDIRLN